MFRLNFWCLLGFFLCGALHCEATTLSPCKTITQAIGIADPYSSGSLYAKLVRERGMRPVAILSTPELPDWAKVTWHSEDYPDEPIPFENDIERLTHRLKEYQLKHQVEFAAIIPGSDGGISIAEGLGWNLKLNSNKPTSTDLRRDKEKMHLALKRNEVPFISQFASDGLEAILDWIHNRPDPIWPVMLKPLQGGGGEGSRICHSDGEVKEAFDKIYGTFNSYLELNQKVLVSDFVDNAPEYFVETASANGQHELVTVFKYEKVRLPHKTLNQVATMVPLNDPVRRRLFEYTRRVLNAVDHRWGAAHTEIFDRPNASPVLVEVNSRIMGSTLPKILNLATGIDEPSLVLDSYLNPTKFHHDISRPLAKQLYAGRVVLLSNQGGVTLSREAMNRIERLPTAAVPPKWNFKANSVVPATDDLDTAVGIFYFASEDPEAARRDVEIARSWRP